MRSVWMGTFVVLSQIYTDKAPVGGLMTTWLKRKWLGGLLSFFVMPISAQVFDLSGDFSIAKNPNGVWEYGFSARSSLAADQFQLDQKSVMIGPIGFWHPTQGDAPGPGYYPYIAYNSTKDTRWDQKDGPSPPARSRWKAAIPASTVSFAS